MKEELIARERVCGHCSEQMKLVECTDRSDRSKWECRRQISGKRGSQYSFFDESDELQTIYSSICLFSNDILLLQHPYIYPVTDIGILAQKPFVFVVEPFHKKWHIKRFDP